MQSASHNAKPRNGNERHTGGAHRKKLFTLLASHGMATTTANAAAKQRELVGVRTSGRICAEPCARLREL